MSTRVHSKHSVYNLSYHIIWIPKYRKHILTGQIHDTLHSILLEKAKSIGCSIEAFEIMPDHIHIFLVAKPTLTVSYIVNQLKGYSSYALRKQFPFLKKYKHLWTNSYYCESIRLISQKTVKRYIEMQRYV